jgi:hypothetical protein
MRRAFAMIHPFNPRSARALALLLLIGMALPMSGCGGCGQSDADKEQAEAQKAEQQKKDDAKKKKEKPKPDFEVSMLRVQPADPEQPIPAAKPGHWLSVTRKMTANNFDFVGSLQADVAAKSSSDGNLAPLALDRQPFVLLSTRNAVLPKGQTKYLDQTLFIPHSEHSPWVRDRLLTRGETPVVEPPSEQLTRMPAYQYYFLILARESSRYKSFARKDALFGPSWDGNMSYYRVNIPRIDKYIPLPSNPLTWTSTAFVLWDDVDPSLLSPEQQQAMLDWLEWGGQLIISGPDTLALLKGSFLDAYLPATAGKSRSLTAESLAPLVAVVQPAYSQEAAPVRTTLGSLGQQNGEAPANINEVVPTPASNRTVPPLEPVRPWSGVALELRPAAHWLPDEHSDLIAECAVGRGRIVTTAFHLNQRDLINWPGFDMLLNAYLLRHPARKFVESNSLDQSVSAVWADDRNDKFDARLTCGLRYLTRDVDADGTFANGGTPRTAELQLDDGSTLVNLNGQLSPYPSPSPTDDSNSIDQIDPMAIGSGVAGWNDFSGMSAAARESLRSAAGITIPRSNFIAWMLAGYLVVLGPLNWGFFRLIGRIEWAWVAAPVIAILGAVVVTKAAHLNIGFARSQTEIDVVELQPNYARAHLTRYTALYTSLSTSYDIQFDDPHALVQPFAAGGESRLKQTERTVTLHRDADVRLTDFDVSSNSTAMLHSEQMFDFGGGIALSTQNGRQRIINRSKHTLHQSGVVWRDADGDLQSAWIGDLSPGEAGQLLDFQPIDEKSSPLPKLATALSAQPQLDDSGTPRLKNSAILSIIEHPKGTGEMRLIGLLDEPLLGMEVTPASSQATRAGVFVVANLSYPAPPRPQPDQNLRPPKNVPLEPAEEPAADPPKDTPQ